jgi:putative transcriptional regulator
MAKTYKSKIARAVHGAMNDAYKAGVIDKRTMREFDQSCLTMVDRLSAREIKKLRQRERVSQAVLAQHLNVDTKLVGEWERGERNRPGRHSSCWRWSRPRASTPLPDGA